MKSLFIIRLQILSIFLSPPAPPFFFTLYKNKNKNKNYLLLFMIVFELIKSFYLLAELYHPCPDTELFCKEFF